MSELLRYAGIGSRKTPMEVLDFMTRYATIMDKAGYILCSGGAQGADTAFADGAGLMEIYRPENATPEAIAIAKEHHPNWGACNTYTRRLHGRNAQILLGKKLDQPVKFVICWTPGGRVTGGTGLGLRIAETYNIPVINLGSDEFIF